MNEMLRQRLQQAGQDHIPGWWPRLSEPERCKRSRFAGSVSCVAQSGSLGLEFCERDSRAHSISATSSAAAHHRQTAAP